MTAEQLEKVIEESMRFASPTFPGAVWTPADPAKKLSVASLAYDGRVGAVLDPTLDLKFGRRTADGKGTDWTRFNQQCYVVVHTKYGHALRFEVGLGDVAQWAALSQQFPCVVLIGDMDFRVRPGDKFFYHWVGNMSNLGSELFWELHNTGSVSSTIAPVGLLRHTPDEMLVNGQFKPATDRNTEALVLRMCGGKVPPGGGNQDDGHGGWHSNVVIPGTQPVPNYDLHILIYHDCQEDNNGTITVKVWKDGDPAPSQPQMTLINWPTTVWIGDGASRVHDALYPQWGAYGYPSDTDTMIAPGWVAARTEADALAAFGAAPVEEHPLGLHETKRVGDLVYVSWNAEPGAYGYHLYRNGQRVSRILAQPGEIPATTTHFSLNDTDTVGVASVMASETKHDTLIV